MNDDAHLVFVDTNVLVYAHDASGGVKTERARILSADLNPGSLQHGLSIRNPLAS